MQTLKELGKICLFEGKALTYEAIKDPVSRLFAGQVNYEKNGKMVKTRTVYRYENAEHAIERIKSIHSQMIQADTDKDDLRIYMVIVQDNARVNKVDISSLVNPGESQNKLKDLMDETWPTMSQVESGD
jgi:hypothetical protein